jgi:hypothetical protein
MFTEWEPSAAIFSTSLISDEICHGLTSGAMWWWWSCVHYGGFGKGRPKIQGLKRSRNSKKYDLLNTSSFCNKILWHSSCAEKQIAFPRSTNSLVFRRSEHEFFSKIQFEMKTIVNSLPIRTRLGFDPKNTFEIITFDMKRYYSNSVD